MRAFWAVAALALATFPAHAQSMTAREMYYGENLREDVKAKPRPPRKAPVKPKAPGQCRRFGVGRDTAR